MLGLFFCYKRMFFEYQQIFKTDSTNSSAGFVSVSNVQMYTCQQIPIACMWYDLSFPLQASCITLVSDFRCQDTKHIH
jgi:hypothetical protein